MEKNRKKKTIKPVSKPFLKGVPWDTQSLKSSLFFFLSLLGLMAGFLIIGGMMMWNNTFLRVTTNLVLLGVVYAMYFYNGASRGTTDVNAGEILYTRQETGRSVDENELQRCFHAAKGFLIALVGSIPLLVCGLIFACTTQVQLTTFGALPSWVSGVIGRAEVGDAIAYYQQSATFGMQEFLRLVVRMNILPIINIVGTGNAQTLLLVERLCVLPLLLPALSYGIGYTRGVAMRTRIHTDIAKNQRRARKKQKQQLKKKQANTASKGPERLN